MIFLTRGVRTNCHTFLRNIMKREGVFETHAPLNKKKLLYEALPTMNDPA